MKSKTEIIRKVPMPNGVYRIICLVDGWKEVIFYTTPKEKPKKGKKGKKK